MCIHKYVTRDRVLVCACVYVYCTSTHTWALITRGSRNKNQRQLVFFFSTVLTAAVIINTKKKQPFALIFARIGI